MSQDGWILYLLNIHIELFIGLPRSPGGLSPSTCLTRSGTVFLSEYSCSPAQLHSRSCSPWHTLHVLSAGTCTQEALAIPNKVSLMHYICGIQIEGPYTHFFCMELRFAFNSVLDIPPPHAPRPSLF